MIARILCLLAGAAFVGVEAFGVGSFLHEQQRGWDYIALGGVLVAVVTPFLPAAAAWLWRLHRPVSVSTWGAFLVGVAIVLTAGVTRTGTAVDNAEGARVRDHRTLALAQEQRTAALADLADAKEQARVECAGKGEKGKQCSGERARVIAAQARVDAAVVDYKAAPINYGDPGARRIAELLPISENAVHLYSPMMLPIAMFWFGTIFITGGLHPQRRFVVTDKPHPAPLPAMNAPAEERPEPAALPAKKVPRLVHVGNRQGAVAAFLAARTRPDNSAEVSLDALGRAYGDWCRDSQFEPVSSETFVRCVHKACVVHGIETERVDRSVLCKGLRLLAHQATPLRFG